ncbi:MAG: LysE family translocator [Rhizobiales bacterium]|nr:LysE family translocator [Hyphomicrobiales bacterium]
MNEFLNHLPIILIAYLAFTLALISPGPNVLAIMATSMDLGRKQALSMASGVALGTFIIGALSALGLASLLALYANAIYVIKIIGAVYLAWLAFKAFKSALSKQDMSLAGKAKLASSNSKYFFSGLIVQVTNPKSIMAWVAILSIGLNVQTPNWVIATIVIGTAFISLGINSSYALLFSSNFMVKLYAKARRSIQTAFGIFFSFAALKLFTSKI